MLDRMSVKADGPGLYHSEGCGQSLRDGRDELPHIVLVLVVVVVLPTLPRRLKLVTSPRRLDSERLRQASREATSGRLFSNCDISRGDANRGAIAKI
jgi:hypothetical protein